MDPSEFRRRKRSEGTDLKGRRPQAGSLRHDEGSSLQRARAESPPERAAVTHGGYSRGPLHCDACKIAETCERYQAGELCALDVEFTQRRRRELAQALQESGHKLQLHAPLIERAVLTGLLVERMTRYLAVYGDLHGGALRKGTVAAQPGAEYLLKAISAERQALEALNLTPAAMAKLRAQQEAHGPVSELGMAVHRAGALEEGVTDAEFEEEGKEAL